MIDRHLENMAPAKFDEMISNWLSSNKFSGGGKTMIVAIENEEGKVYRELHTTGLGEFMDTVGFLCELGLEDILFDKNTPIKGYDARFALKS